jgi:hypothetical protein
MNEKSGLLDLIKKKRFASGQGVTAPPPEKGLKRFFFLLGTHLWKIVMLNLLFLAFSIPVVTIPAAICGMNRALIKLVREGNCFIWSEFIKEFKANIFKSLPFGLLSAFLLFDSYYFFSLSISNQNGGINVWMAAVGFLLLGFEILLSSYVFVFLPTLALKNKFIAKNALIFVITEWKTNLLILGCSLVMALIIAAFFPYSVLLLMFLWFALSQFIVCNAVDEPLQRRIIGPFEQRQEQGS